MIEGNDRLYDDIFEFPDSLDDSGTYAAIGNFCLKQICQIDKDFSRNVTGILTARNVKWV